VVKRLLSIKNIVPDEIDLFGLTPLREAVVGGHLGACKLLLETGGVDSNRKFGGGTVLHQAASRGHTEIVEVLLSMGTVDPYSRDKRHRTPLHWAAVHERVQTVNLLLANEAVDPNAQDDFGRTPLHLSAWHNRNSGIVNMLLLAKGVKEDVRDKKRRDPIYYALKRHPLNVRILDLLFETDFVASLPELISMADDFRSQEFAALLQDTATDLEVEWC
jgi:ankyrin repeat protein